MDHKIKGEIEMKSDVKLAEAPVPNYDVRRVEVYRDNRGITIEAHTPIGTAAAPLVIAKPLFLSPVNVPVQTPQGTQPMPIVVPITAATIYEAFQVAEQQINDRAPSIVHKNIERLKGEMRKQQLANVGNTPLPARHGG